VSAKWVAGAVKARLLLERRAGVDTVLELARASSLRDALVKLAGTAYADAAAAPSLERAQRAVAGSTLLRLRVLAAWLPPGEAAGLRSLAAWFELCNIEGRLAYLAGGPLETPFELGVLSSVWDAAATAGSPEELWSLLGNSSWGDPGITDPTRLPFALRVAWADRVRAELPEARSWATGAAAILLAEELLVARHAVEPAVAQRAGLGSEWQDAGSPAELRERLPERARWALTGIEERTELWRARPTWWLAVEADAQAMVRASHFGRETVVGVVALLALDAVRVATALAVAAQGGAQPSQEVLDALC
jgi:hypothetical protein